jgi:hypothetical protein
VVATRAQQVVDGGEQQARPALLDRRPQQQTEHLRLLGHGRAEPRVDRRPPLALRPPEEPEQPCQIGQLGHVRRGRGRVACPPVLGAQRPASPWPATGSGRTPGGTSSALSAIAPTLPAVRPPMGGAPVILGGTGPARSDPPVTAEVSAAGRPYDPRSPTLLLLAAGGREVAGCDSTRWAGPVSAPFGDLCRRAPGGGANGPRGGFVRTR